MDWNSPRLVVLLGKDSEMKGETHPEREEWFFFLFFVIQVLHESIILRKINPFSKCDWSWYAITSGSSGIIDHITENVDKELSE